MKKKGAALWIVIIAACFFFLGMLANRYVLTASGGAEPTYLERLTRDLGLTDEQKKAIAGCLDEEDAAIVKIIDEYREPIRLAIQDVRDATREKIRGVLDESQRDIFDSGGLFSK